MSTLEEYLEHYSLSEAEPFLVAAGIERVADLSLLGADDLDTLGLPPEVWQARPGSPFRSILSCVVC